MAAIMMLATGGQALAEDAPTDAAVNVGTGSVAFTMGPSYWREDLPARWHFGGWFAQLYYIRPDGELWVRSWFPFSALYLNRTDINEEVRELRFGLFSERYGLSRYDRLHEKVLEDVVYVTDNGLSVFALQSNGTLWGWGSPAVGQLGIGYEGDYWGDWVTRPARIMDGVVSVHAGANFNTYAITADGTLWGWGGLWLGIPNAPGLNERWYPQRIMDNVSTVTPGPLHTMAITNNGGLYTWGLNEFGQLGDGTTEDRWLLPIRIMENVRYASTVCPSSRPSSWALARPSANYSFAITQDNVLWAWGVNDGQIGDGTMEDRLSPVPIMENVQYVRSFTMIGMTHSFAITQDGSLWGWGQGYFTQHPDGEISDGLRPVMIKRDAASIWHAPGVVFVIDSLGSVWFSDTDIEIADGELTLHREPFEHDPDAGTFVYMNSQSHIMLKDDGSLWDLNEDEILPAGSVRVER